MAGMDDWFSSPTDSMGGGTYDPLGQGSGNYGGPQDQNGNPWNSGSPGLPVNLQLGDTYLGGLYGTLYNPTQDQIAQMNDSLDPGGIFGQQGNIGGGMDAGGDAPEGGYPSSGYSDVPYWGTVGDPTTQYDNGTPGPTSMFDYTNGSDVNSDSFSQGDLASAPGYGGSGDGNIGSSGPGAWAGNVWDFLNSKLGKLGTGVLSMAFPSIGLPLMAGRTIAGLASGHGGEAIGGDLGGFAQGAMGLPGMALGLLGIGPSAIGSGLGRSIDNGTFGNGGGGMSYFDGGYNPSGGGMSGGGGLGGLYGMGQLGQNSGVSGFGNNVAAGLGSYLLGKQNNKGIQTQINGLNSLYSPNSPYAQQMAQALERQDAASGRRSQYGTRAVELQAALANAASRNAPTLANLYGQQRDQRTMQLMNLFGMGRNLGLFNGGIGNGGGMGPQDMGWFNNLVQNPYFQGGGQAISQAPDLSQGFDSQDISSGLSGMFGG